MTVDTSWTLLRTCATGLEVDMYRALLESHDIPVLVRGDKPGILGPGFQGAVMGGLELYVPVEHLETAHALTDGSEA